TLDLAKVDNLHGGRVRPLAWCSRPSDSPAPPGAALMDRVIAAGILGMVIGILAGPKFIDFLRERELGQHIRDEMPAGHVVKQGTPTMGGLLIVIGAAIPFLLLSRYTLPAL